MPKAPPRACPKGPCPHFQPCPVHRREAWQAVRVRRGTTAQRGYGASHRRWRAAVLAAHPLCPGDELRGKAMGRAPHPPYAVTSEVADHVQPLRDGGDWSLENGQGLCAACHGRKSAAESIERRTE